jgi:hypothetical protein
VDVSHRAISFICRFWKPPRAGEVLLFFVDRFVLILFRGLTSRYGPGCTDNHNPASLTPQSP